MKYDHHDHLVMLRINRHLQVANSKFRDETISFKLEMAWAANIKEREINAATSLSLIGRDSDHYFAGRRATSSVAAYAGGSKAAKVAVALGGQMVNQGYDLLKFTSNAIETITGATFMRSNPDLPSAPVGGTMWFTRGEIDALGDQSDAVKPIKLHSID